MKSSAYRVTLNMQLQLLATSMLEVYLNFLPLIDVWLPFWMPKHTGFTIKSSSFIQCKVITARQRCEKVMFSQVFVCSRGRGQVGTLYLHTPYLPHPTYILPYLSPTTYLPPLTAPPQWSKAGGTHPTGMHSCFY